jgi:hypothetical protein
VDFALAAAVLVAAGCGGHPATADDSPVGELIAAETLGGNIVDGPAVASPAPRRYDVYAQAGDQIWHRPFSFGRWGSWTKIVAAGVASKPAAVSWGPGRVDLVARASDGSLLHWWGDGDSFSGPESLGGSFLYAPAIASRGPGQLQVFAIASDHQLHVREWNGSTWSSWSTLGGWCNASPAAVSMDASSTDVLVRGSDNGLWRRWQRGSTWFGFESLGGTLTSGPAAASIAPGRLEVYARDAAGAIAAITLSPLGWEAWKTAPVSGGVTSDPAAINARNQPCDHLFFRQSDGSLGHRGCADTTVVTLVSTEIGLPFQPRRLASAQGSFETTVFSRDRLAPYLPLTMATLEGVWPRELYLFDSFDSEKCTGAGCLFPPVMLAPAKRRYSTLPAWQHVGSGGFDLSLDFGPFGAFATTSYPVQQARLIDHGECSIKTRWTRTVYDDPARDLYPDPEGVGVFAGVFADVYQGIRSGMDSSAAQTVTREHFYMEPTFLTPASSTDLRAHDDGFALSFAFNIHTTTSWYLPNSNVRVSGAANYKLGLDPQGLLTVSPVGAVAGSVDKDLVAAIATIFGVPIQTSADLRAQLRDGLPKAIRQAFIDQMRTIPIARCDSALDPASQAARCAASSAPLMKIALREAMVKDGMTKAAAETYSTELASKLTAASFACVPDSEGTPGLCKYHPAFKRLNVLPDGFELVVSDSDEMTNNDMTVMSFLSPETVTACRNSARKPPVSDRHLYRLDGDVWLLQ